MSPKPPRLDPNASNDPKDWITVTGPAWPPGKPLDNVIAAVKERGGKVLGRYNIGVRDPQKPLTKFEQQQIAEVRRVLEDGASFASTLERVMRDKMAYETNGDDPAVEK